MLSFAFGCFWSLYRKCEYVCSYVYIYRMDAPCSNCAPTQATLYIYVYYVCDSIICILSLSLIYAESKKQTHDDWMSESKRSRVEPSRVSEWDGLYWCFPLTWWILSLILRVCNYVDRREWAAKAAAAILLCIIVCSSCGVCLLCANTIFHVRWGHPLSLCVCVYLCI